MSGGVGPSCDISLPKEEDQHEGGEPSSFSKGRSTSTSSGSSRRGGLLSFRQLNCIAIMTVLAGSGMVSLQHIGLVLFSIVYIYLLSKVAFPTLSSAHNQPVFSQTSIILNLYVLFAAVIGLFLPILYIFEGIFEGDKDGIKAAVPHVFLLASQVFMEGLAFSTALSLPIRVFVPVFYNSVRMFTLVDWLDVELTKPAQGSTSTSIRRLYVGRALALVNFAFWAFNLLAFLLPVYLPKAFKIYYTSAASTSSSKKD